MFRPALPVRVACAVSLLVGQVAALDDPAPAPTAPAAPAGIGASLTFF